MVLLFIYIMSMAWFANLVSWKFEFEAWLWIKKNYLTMRLFNCSACFGFWFGLLITIILSGSLIIGITIALIISCIATIMETNLCRLN